MPLANPLSRLHRQFGQVGVKRAPTLLGVVEFHHQAISPRPATANHGARQNRQHRSPRGCGVIPAGMHQPSPEHRVNPHAEVTAHNPATAEGASTQRTALLAGQCTVMTGLQPLRRGQGTRMGRSPLPQPPMFIGCDDPLLLETRQRQCWRLRSHRNAQQPQRDQGQRIHSVTSLPRFRRKPPVDVRPSTRQTPPSAGSTT